MFLMMMMMISSPPPPPPPPHVAFFVFLFLSFFFAFENYFETSFAKICVCNGMEWRGDRERQLERLNGTAETWR